jgi:RNA recognition motif-containing protein
VNIYVGNLLFDVGENDLREAFEKFGNVTEVRLIMDKYSGKSKGFAFIEMPDSNEAQKAIDEMNAKEFMGREIKVSQAKEKTSGGRGGRGGGFGRGRSGPGGRAGGRGGFGNSRGGRSGGRPSRFGANRENQ